MSHYVYVAFDADRRCLYVGCTNDVRRRMREHAHNSGWHKLMNTLSVLTFPTREEAESAEGNRIQKLRPLVNVNYNPRYRSVEGAIAIQAWFDDFDRQYPEYADDELADTG